MIQRCENPLTGEHRFVWTRKGKDDVVLRRVAGGIGWPGKGQAGMVLALGEEERLHPEFPDQHALHVLGEWAEWQGEGFLTVPAMFQAVGAIQRVALVQEWWSEDRPEFRRELRVFNQSQAGLRRAPVRLARPRDTVTPEWLAMRVYLRTSGRKTMSFHHADRTRAALSALGRDLSELTWRTSPEVTALLMAMSAMESRDYQGQTTARVWRPADPVAGY